MADEAFTAVRRRAEEILGLGSKVPKRNDAKPAALATLDRLLAAYEAGTLDPELAAEQCVEMPRDCGV